MPASKSFQAFDSPACEIDAWLVVNFKLLSLDSNSQSVFELDIFGRSQVEFLGEYAISILANVLRTIHCRIGVFQKRLHIRPVVRIDADPDAPGHDIVIAEYRNRLRDVAKDILRNSFDIRQGLYFGQHNNELVATLTRHCIPAAHALAEALGHGPQHLVASMMANCVVDHLEAIQIKEQDTELDIGSGCLFDGLLEAVTQKSSVR